MGYFGKNLGFFHAIFINFLMVLLNFLNVLIRIYPNLSRKMSPSKALICPFVAHVVGNSFQFRIATLDMQRCPLTNVLWDGK
jgi:hypothetical protein